MILDEVKDNQGCREIVWSMVDITRLEETTELEAALIICGNTRDLKWYFTQKGKFCHLLTHVLFQTWMLFLLSNTNSRYFELLSYTVLECNSK